MRQHLAVQPDHVAERRRSAPALQIADQRLWLVCREARQRLGGALPQRVDAALAERRLQRQPQLQPGVAGHAGVLLRPMRGGQQVTLRVRQQLAPHGAQGVGMRRHAVRQRRGIEPIGGSGQRPAQGLGDLGRPPLALGRIGIRFERRSRRPRVRRLQPARRR
jgi:hypothetical protein